MSTTTTESPPASDRTTWVTLSVVTRALGTYDRNVRALADRGLIRSRKLGDSRRTYALEDALRLANGEPAPAAR